MFLQEQFSWYKRTRLKVWKINSATDTLTIICKKFSEQIIENGTGQILLMVILRVGLWLKLQMKIVD